MKKLLLIFVIIFSANQGIACNAPDFTRVFNDYDADKDKKIDFKEHQKIAAKKKAARLKKLEKAERKDIGKKDINAWYEHVSSKAVFNSSDADKNGTIEFNEFESYYMTNFRPTGCGGNR